MRALPPPAAAAVIVKVEDATELCDSPTIAIAWTVDEALIESAPEYIGEELVGAVPSVV